MGAPFLAISCRDANNIAVTDNRTSGTRCGHSSGITNSVVSSREGKKAQEEEVWLSASRIRFDACMNFTFHAV